MLFSRTIAGVTITVQASGGEIDEVLGEDDEPMPRAWLCEHAEEIHDAFMAASCSERERHDEALAERR